SVHLWVGGEHYVQPMTVVMDPRVKTPAAGLKLQDQLSMDCYNGRKDCLAMLSAIKAWPAAHGAQVSADSTTLKKISAISGEGNASDTSLSSLAQRFQSLQGLLQSADVTPTSQAVSGVANAKAILALLRKEWNALKTR
ncbi:MAG TPA: hypothetical protein VGC95_05145, partial [Chitinophagaceae bacterium]